MKATSRTSFAGNLIFIFNKYAKFKAFFISEVCSVILFYVFETETERIDKKMSRYSKLEFDDGLLC